MMEFTFEQPAWEIALNGLRTGGCLSAPRFLAMMEPETEETLEEALGLLEDKDVLLEIEALPVFPGDGETGTRLRREAQLARQGQLTRGLEENDPLRLYLEETAGSPQTDPQALAERYLAGTVTAEALLSGMLSRVTELAFGLTGKGVLLMDLIQEGNLGLWQGILSYTGGDFAAWCDRAIRRAMHRCVTIQARAAGVGQKMRQALEDYRAVDERLLTELGRNPTLEEIADGLHMTLEETEAVARMLDAARTVSRAKAEADPEPQTQDDQLAVEDTAYFQSRTRIAELLSGLDERSAQLLRLRFGLDGGLPLSPEQTGKKLDMTAEEVVAAEAAALAKLRNQ